MSESASLVLRHFFACRAIASCVGGSFIRLPRRSPAKAVASSFFPRLISVPVGAIPMLDTGYRISDVRCSMLVACRAVACSVGGFDVFSLPYLRFLLLKFRIGRLPRREGGFLLRYRN